MNLQGKVINVLGDSITEGVGASDPGLRFTDVLARQFGCRVNNYGISGSRIARQVVVTAEPYDRDFCMRVDEMDADADAVVIFGGTNDYGHGEAPLGANGDRQPDTFYGACHYLMDHLLTRYPGKPVLICTPLRVYRDILLEVAFQYSLPVLDLYATSGIQPANPAILRALLPDGLHPSDAGHALLARRIGLALEGL